MNIDNALARAQKLMLDPNFNNLVESKVAARRGRKLPGASNDLSDLEAQAFGHSVNNNSFSAPVNNGGYVPQYNPQYQATPQYAAMGQPPIQMLQETRQMPNQQNSQLPKNILESFAETPPLSGDDMTSIPQSYFGNTTPQQPQYAPQPQFAGGIDYNIIKQMVKEAIAESGKGILNENAGSTFRGMRIAEGSVIQFIDNKGNLFEGTLKLKKRAQK